MNFQVISAAEALQRLGEFDAVIDARSESEYAEDRLPGAVNWPVLNDAERALVGTEYKQVSAFEARKRGAALVSRNIAAHIERELLDKPRDWKPLIYCWRGGQRSGSMALVLSQIGFRVHLVDGGYRAYRREVLRELEELPRPLHFRVLCGETGSGKSRLLLALERQGAQVLDLERLACHRGSVLGLLPGEIQPSQKAFESSIRTVLRGFYPSQPVYVESESRKVGELRVPEVLIERMRAAECLRVELSLPHRVELLMEDYDCFVRDTAAFCARLELLTQLRGRAVVQDWQLAAREGRTAEVVEQLLVQHYDPIYRQSMQRNFSAYEDAPVLRPASGRWEDLDAAARELLAGSAPAAVGAEAQPAVHAA
ncbi:tRNA 2-selenouridine(34) synthase MnmH [Caldimonas tepidiphila]|uniref:tRNA 2-selenouridine(34) synthase MnmH n=1 Tax=Caldimonas tepidiphila TaxID=2315841 RepID=UPI000E5C280A|nr:tRNA 2-selenouridine(34) synthase MnmH [Caldimonas tepidiphila]